MRSGRACRKEGDKNSRHKQRCEIPESNHPSFVSLKSACGNIPLRRAWQPAAAPGWEYSVDEAGLDFRPDYSTVWPVSKWGAACSKAIDSIGATGGVPDGPIEQRRWGVKHSLPVVVRRGRWRPL